MTEKPENEIRIPRRYRANYSHWNLMRTITITQATYLAIGIEPDTRISDVIYLPSKIIKQRFDEILELGQSWAGSEILPCVDFWQTEVFPNVWLNWLEEMSIPVPKEWHPIKCNLKQNNPETDSPKRRIYEEAVAACIALAEAGNPPTQLANELVTYIRAHPGTYEQCVQDAER